MQSPVKVAFLISFAVFLVGVLAINEAVFNKNLWILFIATIYLFTTLWCLVYEVINLLYQARIRQPVYLEMSHMYLRTVLYLLLLSIVTPLFIFNTLNQELFLALVAEFDFYAKLFVFCFCLAILFGIYLELTDWYEISKYKSPKKESDAPTMTQGHKDSTHTAESQAGIEESVFAALDFSANDLAV